MVWRKETRPCSSCNCIWYLLRNHRGYGRRGSEAWLDAFPSWRFQSSILDVDLGVCISKRFLVCSMVWKLLVKVNSFYENEREGSSTEGNWQRERGRRSSGSFCSNIWGRGMCKSIHSRALCRLNWRQETFLSFQGLSQAGLLLMRRPVWRHFHLPFCCSTFSLSPLPLPCVSTLHALGPHLQRPLLLPVCFLLWLSGLTSEAGIQHDAGLLPLLHFPCGGGAQPGGHEWTLKMGLN